MFWLIRATALAVTPLILFTISPAVAAEYNHALSSADKDDPFDGVLGVRYNWQFHTSAISREAGCEPGTPACDATTSSVSEMKSERTVHTLDIDARFGLYHDMELYFLFPFILSDQTNLSFADGVSRDNSSIFPNGDSALFELPNTGAVRKGFGDMTVGLRYSPMSQWRKPYYPTLTLNFAYQAPTGSLKKADNADVGKGLHQIHIEIAASRKLNFVEPYFAMYGHLRMPNNSGSDTTLYKQYDAQTQRFVGPGHQLGLVMGTEWFAWDRPRKDGKPDRFATIDLGFSAIYTFQGREATDLFEALGNSTCDENTACASASSTMSNKLLTQYDHSAEPGVTHAITYMDGITDVSPYGILGAWANVRVRPIPYLELSLGFKYEYETAHFLTFADTGEDTNGDGIKLPTTQNPTNEYNPVFNSDVDYPGNRLRSEGSHNFNVMVSISGRI